MGIEQNGIEHAFEAALAAAWTNAGAAAGIGLAGGFGGGKSHMLAYLAEVARQGIFLVSKETPQSHPGHVLAAALRGAARPTQ